MTIHRRALLRAGVTASAALAARADAGTTSADPCAMPSAGGELRCDDRVLAGAAEDFGHIIHRRPQFVFRPTSVTGIADVMRWTASRGLKVAARGQGHSTYGRAMADGGVVLDMTAMSTIRQVQSDRIVVDAGATWRAVLEATLAHGLTPPVLTNYLDLSVAERLPSAGLAGRRSAMACRRTISSN